MTSSSEQYARDTEARIPVESVCIVVTVPFQLRLWIDQIAALSRNYDFSCLANCDDPDWLRQRGIAAPLQHVRIERAPHPIHDIRALWSLLRRFKQNRFDVVHSVSPKAGLLAMTAAALTSIPVRIHTFTGQVWANRSGLSRFILKAIDSWTATMATHILVDSESQRSFLVKEGVLRGSKSRVLGQGSIGGVDTQRFRPNDGARAELRAREGVPSSAIVFIYLGRWKRDKGVVDLAQAFSRLASICEDAWLFVVGPDEDQLETEIREICRNSISRTRFMGDTDNPECWLAASDVLCLPSYREGFGCTIIEAASVGLPAVGSRIYGITDAIEEGVTGVLHEPGDVAGIAAQMLILATDKVLREFLGNSARQRAYNCFRQEMVTTALLDFYRRTITDLT